MSTARSVTALKAGGVGGRAPRVFELVVIALFMVLCTSEVFARDFDKYLIQCDRSLGLVSAYHSAGEFYTKNCRAVGMELIRNFDNQTQPSDDFRWINCQAENFPDAPSQTYIQVQGKTDLVTYTFYCSVLESPDVLTGDFKIRNYSLQDVAVLCAAILSLWLGWGAGVRS